MVIDDLCNNRLIVYKSCANHCTYFLGFTLNPTLLSRQKCQSDFTSFNGTWSCGLKQITLVKIIWWLQKQFRTILEVHVTSLDLKCMAPHPRNPIRSRISIFSLFQAGDAHKITNIQKCKMLSKHSLIVLFKGYIRCPIYRIMQRQKNGFAMTYLIIIDKHLVSS
jgi:hypothetical protein